ncbi:hypothetical protein ACXKGW_29640, partial [Klebsiella pneumoniae subsp. pneumoniae]
MSSLPRFPDNSLGRRIHDLSRIGEPCSQQPRDVIHGAPRAPAVGLARRIVFHVHRHRRHAFAKAAHPHQHRGISPAGRICSLCLHSAPHLDQVSSLPRFPDNSL